MDELYHLAMAAHYLDVPQLLDLCTDAMADHIRGKSPSQVRACFGLEQNLSSEEVRLLYTLLLWSQSQPPVILPQSSQPVWIVELSRCSRLVQAHSQLMQKAQLWTHHCMFADPQLQRLYVKVHYNHQEWP